MLFSSITFLCYFLPVVLVAYFLAPPRWGNVVLLAASLIFYSWGGPSYVALMLALITLGYFFGLGIERTRGSSGSKACLAAGLICTVAALFYFKYADFAISSFNYVTGADAALLGIVLPVGISFYTFQLMSYLVDVYRGEPACRNWIVLATYIAMFPQLVAGPIVRYADIRGQLGGRTFDWGAVGWGARRFVLGLAKKVLIANQLFELTEIFRATQEPSVLFCWLYALAFMLCIYFDFSGYSDMAIGLGRIFGFTFKENFNYPYISCSVTEFWRRWHISLGSWFRDYVYIPLGGNRVGCGRWIFNVVVVWAVTGLWHGAAWNFVAWGLAFAVLLVLEKLVFGSLLESSRVLSHVYVLLAVCVSFVVFNAEGLGGAAADLAGMFGLSGLPLVSAEALYQLRSFALVLLLAALGATPVVRDAARRLQGSGRLSRVTAVVEPVILAALLLVCIAYLVDASFNPFLYFRF